METKEPDAAPAASAVPSAPARAPGAGARIVALVIVLAALAASVGLWLDARARLGSMQEEVARRLRGVEDESREVRAAARAAQEGAREARRGRRRWRRSSPTRRASRRRSSRSTRSCRATATSGSWPRSSRCSPSRSSSCSSRATCTRRCSRCSSPSRAWRRADRPQFLAVRRAIARDIERLKALPARSIPRGLRLRIDALLAAVDALPLAFDARLERPAPSAAPAAGAAGALQRFGNDLWREMKDLVIVRRVDQPEPPLLPPSQAWFLRENLRLRLLNARLELLSRNAAGFAEDLRVSRQWMQRYFDVNAGATKAALAELKQLQAAPLNFELPSISDSLDAVRAFKARRERASG